MKRQTALASILLPLAAACSQPTEVPGGDSAADPIPRASLRFASIDEAIAFATDVDHLLAYPGPVWGSERFDVSLPDGSQTDNWTINAFFRDVFREYGEDAFPDLAPLLDHEHTFVQVGAYAVLNSAMNQTRSAADHGSNPR